MKKKIHFIYIGIIIILFAILFITIKIDNNVSKKNNSKPWYFNILSIDVAKKTDKTIAIIDSGLSKIDDLNDFDIIYKHNYINDNQDISDEYGHGTALASVLIGTKNNFDGILDNPKLIILKVMDNFGSSNLNYVNLAILKAIELHADIINLSMGMENESIEITNSINLAIENKILVVSSIGDFQDANATYPARKSGVISVESQVIDGSKYAFSNEFDSTVRIPGFKIPVVSFNKITEQFEITTENGSSLSSIIFCGLLAGNNYDSESIIDYNYLKNCKLNNQFVDLNKIFR